MSINITTMCSACPSKSECWFSSISESLPKLCGDLQPVIQSLPYSIFTNGLPALPEGAGVWRGRLSTFLADHAQ